MLWQVRRGLISGRGALDASASVASYTGPGDVAGYSSAYAYWGLRAYTAAYAATLGPIVDLVDQAGANSITINAKSDGTVDVAAINAWVIAHTVTTIRVTKLHDQSGSGRHVLTAGALAPTLFLSGVGLGSVPSIQFTGGASYFISASNATAQAQPFTISSVVRFNTYAGVGGVFGDGNFGIQFFNGAAADVRMYAGTSVRNGTGVTDGQFGSIQLVFDGSSSSINAANAGTNPTGTPTTVATPGSGGIGSTANKLTVGALTDTGAVPLDGYMFELLIGSTASGAVSSANQSSQVANQRAYGGF